MMKMINRLLLACVAVLGLPLVAEAQLGAAPSPTECSQWAGSIAAGRALALEALRNGRLSECPGAAHVLRSAIHRAGNERDADYLYALAAQAAAVWDSTVFNAAASLAADRRGTSSARAAGILVLIAHLGSSWDFPGAKGPALLTHPLHASGICGPQVPISTGPVAGSTLPEDAPRRVATVLDRIAYDEGAPALLRHLARCGRFAVYTDVPPQVDVSKVRLRYVCENRLRLLNTAPVGLVFRLMVAGVADTMDVDVGPHAHRTLTLEAGGTARLFYDGKLIATATSRPRPCDSEEKDGA
jgi:hypothetical protein